MSMAVNFKQFILSMRLKILLQSINYIIKFYKNCNTVIKLQYNNVETADVQIRY